MYGIDAPELHVKCAVEKHEAVDAQNALQGYLNSPVVLYRSTKPKFDKYGRMLARVARTGVSKRERDVGTLLINDGLVRPYTGGVRPPWPGC